MAKRTKGKTSRQVHARQPAKAKPAPAKRSQPHPPARSAILAVIPKAGQVQFAANERALLVARGMGGKGKKTLTLWDLETSSESPSLAAFPTFSAAALSADNRHVAIGTSTGILAVQSTQTGKVLWKSKAGGDPVGKLLFTLDGSLLIAAAEYRPEGDAWIRVNRVSDGAAEKGFEAVAGAMCCHLALSPDGLFLAHSEMRSHSILIWHLPTRQMGTCIRLPVGRGPIRDLAFGITPRQLFVAQEKQISGWNAENGTRLITMEAQGNAPGFRSVAVIQRGGAVATLRTSPDKSFLELWGAHTAHLRKTIPLLINEKDSAGTLTASATGELLALPGPRECWVWSVEKLLA